MTTHIGACQRCGKESQYRYASQVRKFCSHGIEVKEVRS